MLVQQLCRLLMIHVSAVPKAGDTRQEATSLHRAMLLTAPTPRNCMRRSAVLVFEGSNDEAKLLINLSCSAMCIFATMLSSLTVMLVSVPVAAILSSEDPL
eukprot:697528-Rhodomonas_salina.2